MGGLLFEKYCQMAEINWIFKINAKLLPSLPKSHLAALISASFYLRFSSALTSRNYFRLLSFAVFYLFPLPSATLVVNCE